MRLLLVKSIKASKTTDRLFSSIVFNIGRVGKEKLVHIAFYLGGYGNFVVALGQILKQFLETNFPKLSSELNATRANIYQELTTRKGL